MKAKDVMTTEVITVGPEATVGEIAALMYSRRISGVPVVQDGKVIGIVSEGDLIRRQEIGSDAPRRSWWLTVFDDTGAARRYVKSHARRAADIMTPDPVTVTEETPLSEIAAIFESRHIKRVPVLRDGRLVGIVSRANLVQALASAAAQRLEPVTESDEAIRTRLLAELRRQPWWAGWTGNVTVSDGVVEFWGFYDTRDDRDAARVAAENTPGVKAVKDHRVRYDTAIGAI